jgi:HEAT repeat protein
LIALGRTRAPEAIPALTEALRDRDPETRLAALRASEKMACPEAAKGILEWISDCGLTVPALPVQSALIQCCAERPQMLIAHLEHTQGPVREVLARVLGEVATPALQTSLLQFVDDELPELRAAAARALSQSQPHIAMASLTELSQDPIWFVRLRAVVSLGELRDPSAVSILLRGLADSKRLVRVRAAESLLKISSDHAAMFEEVIALNDRYGTDAYLTAMDNAGLTGAIQNQLAQLPPGARKDMLLAIVTAKSLPTANPIPELSVSAKAASAP